MNAVSLLALQQISDSLFPSGMFAHSLGLEQLARDGTVGTPADVESFVASVLNGSVATSDAVATGLAVRYARAGDLEALVKLDLALAALKAAAELRRASIMTGRRLLEEVALHENARLAEFLGEVCAGRAPGTQAVAFGVVAATFGATPEDAAALVMQTTVTAILQAAMRLLPVSHRDVQGGLHRLRPRIALLAEAAAARDHLETFHPLQEIAAMRHETAPVRMFAS